MAIGKTAPPKTFEIRKSICEGMSKAYKDRLRKRTPALDQYTKDDFKRRAKMYDFIAGLSEPEYLEIFNSGLYDRITQGLILMAATRAGMKPAEIRKLYMNLLAIQPEERAEQAERAGELYAQDFQEWNGAHWSEEPPTRSRSKPLEASTDTAAAWIE